mmetsp:Transcript_96950/g.271358  ORF Transcript_96950/g.271358 Transcript_96950/m.271358 type:complete len:216 (-) Transcript_96950:522-1169(-)
MASSAPKRFASMPRSSHAVNLSVSNNWKTSCSLCSSRSPARMTPERETFARSHSERNSPGGKQLQTVTRFQRSTMSASDMPFSCGKPKDLYQSMSSLEVRPSMCLNWAATLLAMTVPSRDTGTPFASYHALLMRTVKSTRNSCAYSSRLSSSVEAPSTSKLRLRSRHSRWSSAKGMSSHNNTVFRARRATSRSMPSTSGMPASMQTFRRSASLIL